MPEYPPDDQARARADAARALTDALRAVADANERLQFAAAWVLDAFGDSADAETVRMLMPGRRSGRPPVPPAERQPNVVAELAVLDPELVDTPASVTSDESGPEDRGRADALCATEDCGHRRDAHSYDLWECDLCSCGAFL
jgi:hypothetical protein